MKIIIRILLLSLLLQSFQCEQENSNVTEITQEQLVEKEAQILNYINNFACSDASGCAYIAFGAKPCGGPRKFLVFPNTVNSTTLENMINEYYIMDNQYNIQVGAISDCMVVSPPNTVGCIDGVCTIIN
jgi:hypothetical protein